MLHNVGSTPCNAEVLQTPNMLGVSGQPCLALLHARENDIGKTASELLAMNEQRKKHIDNRGKKCTEVMQS